MKGINYILFNFHFETKTIIYITNRIENKNVKIGVHTKTNAVPQQMRLFYKTHVYKAKMDNTE